MFTDTKVYSTTADSAPSAAAEAPNAVAGRLPVAACDMSEGWRRWFDDTSSKTFKNGRGAAAAAAHQVTPGTVHNLHFEQLIPS
jgi:hypothetical protein